MSFTGGTHRELMLEPTEEAMWPEVENNAGCAGLSLQCLRVAGNNTRMLPDISQVGQRVGLGSPRTLALRVHP